MHMRMMYAHDAQVMETREELEADVHSEKLQMLREQNELRTLLACKDLASAFNQGQLAEARSLTAQLQYLNRIQYEITERSDVN